MKLKKNILLLICCIQILTGKSQNILNGSTSLFRPGDIIAKQELQYKAPGPGR